MQVTGGEKRLFKGKGAKKMAKAVYTVSEIKELLGIGKNQAYKLCKSQEFPVRKVGSTILIPKEPFDKWLVGGDSATLD